jgi:hypothetical protein
VGQVTVAQRAGVVDEGDLVRTGCVGLDQVLREIEAGWWRLDRRREVVHGLVSWFLWCGR